jgi:hypothetical protein
MSVTKVTGMMQTSTKGGDITSASPCVIDSDGDYFDLTGTTSFSVFTVTAGRRFTIQFDGVLTMTHHATNLDLPGGANITTAAGDVGEFFATGTNTVQCVNYTKADGTAVVAGASGDLRNFIIDGDFTQWPEGVGATTTGHNTYGSALFEHIQSNDGTATWEQSTDVPTVAASNHTSKYSMLIKCTGTDASIGASQFQLMRYYVTGSDYSALHQKEVTFSFWIKTAANNSGDSYYLTFGNSAGNRVYATAVTPTSTWTKYTKTLTLDTTGTWLFTEADRGLVINFTLVSGADRGAAAQEDAWAAVAGNNSDHDASGTTQDNFLASTSNELYISQVSLVLGSSAPTFLGESIATVKDQVNFYIQLLGGSVGGVDYQRVCGTGVATSSTGIQVPHIFSREMRVAPTITFTTSSGFTWIANPSVAANALTSGQITTFGARLVDSGLSGLTTGFGEMLYANVAANYIKFDARH